MCSCYERVYLNRCKSLLHIISIRYNVTLNESNLSVLVPGDGRQLHAYLSSQNAAGHVPQAQARDDSDRTGRCETLGPRIEVGNNYE